LPDLPETPLIAASNEPSALLDRQQAFGYTQEDIQFFLEPMAKEGMIPSARWAPTSRLRCSPSVRSCSTIISTRISRRWTNPPLDAIREELVTSLVSIIGPRPNLFGRDAGSHKRLEVSQPVLTNADLEKIRAISELLDGAFRTATLDCTWPASEGADGLERAVDRICREATDSVLADNKHPDPV